MKKMIFVATLMASVAGCSVAKTAGSAAVTTGQVALGAADLVL
ncbi:MAG: lipoprotein [Pseudomonadota bacterium]